MAQLRRKTPEELLREVQAEESATRKGHLKIFLGYASGVGKSFRMFDEARRRRERGQDVVVGAVQPQLKPFPALTVTLLLASWLLGTVPLNWETGSVPFRLLAVSAKAA